MSVVFFDARDLGNLGEHIAKMDDSPSRDQIARSLAVISVCNIQAYVHTYPDEFFRESITENEIREMMRPVSIRPEESAAIMARLLHYNCVSNDGRDFSKCPFGRAAFAAIQPHLDRLKLLHA